MGHYIPVLIFVKEYLWKGPALTRGADQERAIDSGEWSRAAVRLEAALEDGLKRTSLAVLQIPVTISENMEVGRRILGQKISRTICAPRGEDPLIIHLEQI